MPLNYCRKTWLKNAWARNLSIKPQARTNPFHCCLWKHKHQVNFFSKLGFQWTRKAMSTTEVFTSWLMKFDTQKRMDTVGIPMRHPLALLLSTFSCRQDSLYALRMWAPPYFMAHMQEALFSHGSLVIYCMHCEGSKSAILYNWEIITKMELNFKPLF